MFSQPQGEHQWLDFLVGDWTFESECNMGPDQPASKSQGKLTAKSLGGLWVICESETPDEGNVWRSQLVIGYDPEQNTYIGTFIASMMTHLWIYSSGQIDETGNLLTLEARGPRMDGSGMEDYRDHIEKVDDNHWILWSQMRVGEDWAKFMEAHYHRA